jgi:hypothetical protein
MDIPSISQDAPAVQWRVPMRYKVGAEQLQQVPSLAHRPDGGVPGGQDRPGGPNPRGVCGDRRHRLRDEVSDTRGAERGLGSGLFCREMLGLFRRRRRPW